MPADRALSEQLIGCWARFARTGDPNGGEAPAWPALEGQGEHLRLDTEVTRGTQLEAEQRLGFAAEALALRFTDAAQAGLRATQLLEPRRVEDVGDDLWRTFNTVQSNLLGGGLLRRSASGRLTRTRPIRAIQRDLELNSRLWDLAIARAA